jgi:hypothetical protein
MADLSAKAAGGGGKIRLMRWLVIISVVLVALQPVSAGLFMSGFGRALPVHAVVGLALQLVLLIQVGAGLLLWRQGRAPGWLAGVSLALFVIVLVQNAFGHNRQYWLHVPIGVALVGALNRQRSSLDTLRPTGAGAV